MSDGLNNKHLQVYAGAALLALVLRLWGLNASGLWFDEAFEYWASAVPFKDLPGTVSLSFQPPLYNILLHFWLMLGDSEVWMRFLSVIFSLGAMLAVMLLGENIFGLGGALVSGLVMAVLPSEIRYGQEVAEYALLSFASAWLVYAKVQALNHPTWKSWGLWGFFSLLAVYSHYGGIILVLGLAAGALVENICRKQYDQVKMQIVVGALGLVLLFPLVYFLPNQFELQNLLEINLTPTSGALNFFEKTGETFLFPLYGWPLTPLPETVILTLVALILGLSPLLWFSKDLNRKRMLAWFWGCYLVYYVLVRSSLYAYGNFGFRYMLILVPLFVLVITGIVNVLLQGKPGIIQVSGVGLLAAVLVTALLSLPNRWISERIRGGSTHPEIQDIREIQAYWAAHPSNDLPTYVYYGAAPGFRYYMHQSGLEAAVEISPGWFASCWQGLTEAECAAGNVTYGAWLRSMPADEKRASLFENLGGTPGRFWIIFSHVSKGEDSLIVEQLSGDYEVEEVFRLVNASAVLLKHR